MKPLRTGLIALTTVVVLAGCTATNDDQAVPDPSQPTRDADTPAVDMAESQAAAGDDSSAASSPTVLSEDDDREVITTGWVTVIAEDPDEVTDDVVALATDNDGRVDGRSESTVGDRPTVELVLRVPPDTVDPIIGDLEEYGDVAQVEVTRDDVTGEVQDLDARINSLETSVERLTGLMDDADNVADLLEAETELTARQGELDSLTQQRNQIGEQVSLSTLTVTITTDYEPVGEPGLLSELWQTLVDSSQAILRVVAALLPWALLAAVVLVPVIAATKRRRARKAGPGQQSQDPANRTERVAGPQTAAAQTSAPQTETDNEFRGDTGSEPDRPSGNS